MSTFDSQFTHEGDGFRYSRDPVTKALSIVVPPQRRASLILFLTFFVALSGAFLGVAVNFAMRPTARGSTLNVVSLSVMGAVGGGLFLVGSFALGTHLLQQTTIEVTRSTVTVRRRRFLITRTVEAELAQGPAFRLGPDQPIQKVYAGNAPAEYAPTGVELVRGTHAFRFAEQLQGGAARQLLDLLTEACSTSVAAGVNVARNIRVHDALGVLTIMMRPSMNRWLATIVMLLIAAGFTYQTITIVNGFLQVGLSSLVQALSLIHEVGLALLGLAVATFTIWYSVQTLTGREIITITDHSLVIHRTSLFGKHHRETSLDSIKSLCNDQPGNTESYADGVKQSKGVLFGTVVISCDAGDIRFGRLCFLDQGSMLVSIIKEHRPWLLSPDASTAAGVRP